MRDQRTHCRMCSSGPRRARPPDTGPPNLRRPDAAERPRDCASARARSASPTGRRTAPLHRKGHATEAPVAQPTLNGFVPRQGMPADADAVTTIETQRRIMKQPLNWRIGLALLTTVIAANAADLYPPVTPADKRQKEKGFPVNRGERLTAPL